MNRHRQILIERYVDLRCKRLQEVALNEFGFDDIKNAASGVLNKAKNVKSNAFDAAKNVKSKAFDAASNIKNTVKDTYSTAKDIGSKGLSKARAGADMVNKGRDVALDFTAPVMGSDLANLAYITPLAGLKATYDSADVARSFEKGGVSGALSKGAEKLGGGMDAMQTGLDVLGTAGAIHPAFQLADLANMGISGTRGAIELARGNTDAAKKHGINTAASLGTAIPYIGDIGNVAKMGVRWGPGAVKAAKGVGNFLSNVNKSKPWKSAKLLKKIKSIDDRHNITDIPSNMIQALNIQGREPVDQT